MESKLNKIKFLILGVGLLFYFLLIANLITSYNVENNPFVAVIILLGGFLEPYVFFVLGLFYLFYFFSQYSKIEKIQKSFLPTIIAIIFSLPLLFVLYLPEIIYTANINISDGLKNILESFYGINFIANLAGSHIVVLVAGINSLIDNIKGWKAIKELIITQKQKVGHKEFYKRSIKKWSKQLFISLIFFFGIALVIGIIKNNISDNVYDTLISIFSPLVGWVLVSFIILISSTIKYSLSKNQKVSKPA